jgi:two-component system cell cycle sensor histidine kinase/response regulator CckA
VSDFFAQPPPGPELPLSEAAGLPKGFPEIRQDEAWLTDALRSVLDALPHAVLVFNLNRRVVFANAMASAMFGPAGNESEHFRNDRNGPFQLVAPDSEIPLDSDRWPLIRALRGETLAPQEFLVRRAESALRSWLLIGAYPVRDRAGTVIAAVLTLQDIGPMKKRELALNEAEKLHSIIYQENLAGIIRTTIDGRILDCNGAIVRMLGYQSKRELLAVRVARIYFDSADRDRILRLLSATGRLSEFEVCFRRRDGARCWVLLNARLLDAPSGQVGGGIVSNVIDITGRKEHEEILRRSEQRFAAFMRHLPGVAFIKDLAGKYVYYNEASLTWFGLRPHDMVGRTDYDIWPGEDSQHSRENDLAVIAAQRPSEFIETMLHADGKHSWRMYKFPIVEQGRVTLVGGVGVDISERTVLEEQLAQARKMEALGRLAGGVAHDFNNLLTVIAGYGQLAIESVGNAPVERITMYLREILDSSRRASALTGQLLAFSRHQVLQPKVLDLGDLLRGMERLLQRVIGEHIELTVHETGGQSLIYADANQMEQAIMNLAVNARDAMLLGGVLELQCDRLAQPVPREQGEPFGVRLEVRDTGIGMDPAVQSQIFDPFFTSKEPGRGTGLGLSTVYGAVAQAKGKIEVESVPGEGTVFRLYFPAAEFTPPAATPPEGTRPESTRTAEPPLAGEGESAPQRSGSAPRERETVLLVEDADSVRILAETILKRQGYNVLVADSGHEALRIWDEHSDAVDVLLTDVIMPQMSGGELAHRLREKRPHLRVLFMSGYTDDMIASHGVLAGETQLIQKPFTAEGLGRKLRAVLDA